MTAEKRRMQKKKSRQKEVQSKLLVRREAKRSRDKEDREEVRAQNKFKKDQKEMIKLEEQMDELYSKLPLKTRAQLERNVEILKALEEEYDKEMVQKQELNQTLEAEGNVTPEGKMKALHEKVVAKQKKDTALVEVIKSENSHMGMGGSADCSFETTETD